MKKTLVFAVLFLPAIISGFSQSYIFNKQFYMAYGHVLNFEKNQALSIIHKENNKEGSVNLMMTYLESSLYFIEAFIKEENTLRVRYSSKFNEWLDVLKTGNKKSPYYNYCIAHLYLQRGLLELKFSGYVQAGLDIRKASRLFEENGSEFPFFYMQYKEQGLLECFIGNVPDQFGWLMGIAGMTGDISAGESKLRTLTEICFSREEFKFLQLESLLYYSTFVTVLGNDVKKTKQLLQYTSRLQPEYSASPLLIFLKATLYSHLGNNDRALLEVSKYKRTTESIPFAYLYYLKGLLLLQKGDHDNAKIFLMRFINEFKGQHYVKSAYHKLAWCWFLEGDTKQYYLYMSMAKNAGVAINDADKQALTESKNGQIPHPVLLKSRLLTDGGYYQEAINLMSGIDSVLICENHRFCVEFLYRKGRIAHLLHDYDQAIDYYKSTIEAGKDDQWYFAANSALMLGLIYEENKNNSLAGYYYNLCMELPVEEYRNSIQQKAKAGLQRIKR